MNETISKLIADAGFSNTYELERLTILCKLSALHCIDTLLKSHDVQSTVASICENFGLEGADDNTE